jgi:hypothetical protein
LRRDLIRYPLAARADRPAIAQSRCETGDELLDVDQERSLLAGESPVISAFELDEARARNVVGEMAASAHANGAVAATVEHRSRHADSV